MEFDPGSVEILNHLSTRLLVRFAGVPGMRVIIVAIVDVSRNCPSPV